MKQVLEYFEEISKIPRCSGNEKGISDFLLKFAKEHGFEAIQDDVLNIIIKKPASPGYEKAPGIILQGHMDMVCEKTKEKQHDFCKDPITLKYKGDMLYADDTTLGADNGIAVAMAMSILTDKNVKHPPLEVLITVDEESGMTGALNLDPKNIEGRILINLDSEEEGKLLTSCAGGLSAIITLDAEWEENIKDHDLYKITINGLLGGHSGMEIDKGRGNSNKLLGRVLYEIYKENPFKLFEINGGTKHNVIPSETKAAILIPSAKSQAFVKEIENWNEILKNELKSSDPDVNISIEKDRQDISKAMNDSITKQALYLLMNIPNGVHTMSKSISGLVESSSNLGVLSTCDKGIYFESSIRSSIETLKYYIKEQLFILSSLVNANFKVEGEYPGWEFDPHSKIRETFVKVYEDKYGEKPEIIAFHAGVECGIFGKKIDNLDMISLGPDTYDVHSVNEHVSIPSIERTYEYLVSVIKMIK